MINIRNFPFEQSYETLLNMNTRTTQDRIWDSTSTVYNFPWLFIPLPPNIQHNRSTLNSKNRSFYLVQLINKVARRIGNPLMTLYPISYFRFRINKLRLEKEDEKQMKIKNLILLVNDRLNLNYALAVDKFKVMHKNLTNSSIEKKLFYSLYLQSYFYCNVLDIVSHNKHMHLLLNK